LGKELIIHRKKVKFHMQKCVKEKKDVECFLEFYGFLGKMQFSFFQPKEDEANDNIEKSAQNFSI
jgi:hypothetical protein